MVADWVGMTPSTRRLFGVIPAVLCDILATAAKKKEGAMFPEMKGTWQTRCPPE
jgi:hypothetical protein